MSARVRPRSIALGTALIGTVFVLLPIAMVRLNAILGWPRWQSALARVAGALLVGAGLALALRCSFLFARVGAGTPMPTDPPKRLVATGPYRYSRNPIFVADVTILLGLFLHRGELALLLYAGLIALVAHALIVGREEPELRARFGADYDRYARRVPRWLGLPLP